MRPDCKISGGEAGAGDEVDNADHVAAAVLAHQLLPALPLRPRGQDVAAQPPGQHDKGGGGRQPERPSTLGRELKFFFHSNEEAKNKQIFLYVGKQYFYQNCTS